MEEGRERKTDSEGERVPGDMDNGWIGQKERGEGGR